jgi:F-type H+-transporting ATPase subunit gamma
MLSSAAVEQQTASLRDIDNIVGAMKAYAGSALRKAEDIVHNVRKCEASIREALALIVAHHPALAPGVAGEGQRILVAFGSSIGLCGAFNDKIADTLTSLATGNDALLIIGRRLRQLAESRELSCVGHLEAPASLEGINTALQESLARIRALYAREEYFSLAFVYMTVSENRAEALIDQVLPPDIGGDVDHNRENSLLTYEPPEELFSGILEEFLSTSLYRCYVESLRSENWFRLRAMEGASEHLQQRIAELGSLQNYLRQEEVTEEMLEILGGGFFYS